MKQSKKARIRFHPKHDSLFKPKTKLVAQPTQAPPSQGTSDEEEVQEEEERIHEARGVTSNSWNRQSKQSGHATAAYHKDPSLPQGKATSVRYIAKF